MKLLFQIRILVLAGLFLFLVDKNLYAQCNCNFTISPATNTSNFDGAASGVKPGDVICLTAGTHARISFSNIKGSPTDYVIIKNCGGQALVGNSNSNSAILFSNSQYFRLTGTGDPNTKYGIKIPETKSSGAQGVSISNYSSDFEVDHLEIMNSGFAGIMAKSDPSKDCSNYSYERPNFTMKNVIAHDNYIHDIGGEGVYFGNSYFRGTTNYCGNRTQYPHEVRGVRVYNNIFENTGWESIQVGAGVQDVEVYNNRIYNYGVENRSSQNGGIQLGEGSVGKIYNNFIKNGTGKAIFVQGLGDNYIFNNVIVNPGSSGSAVIQTALLGSGLPTDIVPPGSFIGPIRIMNNTIVNPYSETIKESLRGPVGNVIQNNLIVGGPSKWLNLRGDTDWKNTNNLYIPLLSNAGFVNPAADDYRLQPTSPAVNVGADVSAYGVSFDADDKSRPSGGGWDLGAYELGGLQKPSVSVGVNQNITLPTNSTTITGSATDADGVIVSYLWTLESGPPATITNAASTTASISNLVAGVYRFRLTATDNDNETGYAELTITVTDPSVNQPPLASAGGNKTVVLPTNSTVLSGSGSDPDGSIVSYEWVKVSGPTVTLTNASTAALTVTDLIQGTYVFRLTVTDDDGDIDTDDAIVTVSPAATNQPPTANAGVDQNLALPSNSITLNGSGNDPDGSIASYLWTKVSGPSATMTNTTTSILQLTNLVEGSYTFRLTVTDNSGATGFDDVVVVVSASNQPPVANAGANKTIQLPTNSTTLSGSGSDSDGTITSYLWTKVSGPTATLSNANTPTLSLTNLVIGTYVFRLTVTDDDGAIGSKDVTLIVQAANIAPVANAGGPKTIILPVNNTTLSGSGTDPDGTIATYLWEKISGSSVTLSGANTATLNLTNLVEGQYVFRLTVTDNNGATGSAETTVTVLPQNINQSPIVNAGVDITITLPTNSIDITGTASDPDGTIASLVWEKISGPAATLSGTTTTTLSLTNLVEGVYIFRFTGTDNLGASANDDVTVTVTSTNQSPIVSAGSNQIIILPTSTAVLQATASDPDGTIASYLWSQSSGPNSPTLSGTGTSTLNISGLIAGTYIFSISVTDNAGASASSSVNIVVQTSTNVNPVANAGTDVTLFLPTNTVNLFGSGTDSDGTIASYAWTQISGVPATLANANTPTLTVTNMVQGIFIFRLTITDNNGGIGIDEVSVNVQPATTNQPPIANAGPDIALSLPTNSTNLLGFGTDLDGQITSYSWNKISGPTATLLNSNTSVLSLLDLKEGVYILRLTVTDNTGATSFDDAQVTVFPNTVNQPPTVSAGNNRTVTLPTSSTTINATATDPDGSIVSYLWTKQIGPPATVFGENSATLTITNLVEGSYRYRITVTDNAGATAFAEINITVLPIGTNQPPIVNAGTDKTVFLPTSTINLSGTASDADGFITSYTWFKLSGPVATTLTNANTPNVSLSNLLAGQYTLRLTVVDNDGASAYDEVTVNVFPGTVNQPPIANAGANKTLDLPNTSILLSGNGFDPDGSIVAYSWTQVFGPSSTIENTNSPTLSVSNLVEGVFRYQLTVEDNLGATGSDIAQVTVVNENALLPPIANAGVDQVVNLPNSDTEIQGSGVDVDGFITSYNWVKKSGPAAGTITGETTSKLSLSNLIAGTYQFTLTVTDNDGLSNSDDVRVTVIPASVNNNPIVNAGNDITLRLPTSSTSITATASDVDGTVDLYAWTKQSGPSAVLAGENSATLSLTGLVEGVYVFRIQVTDNMGGISTDEVTLTVAPPGVNNPPIVSAGSAKGIALPINSTTLIGSASDIDGSIANLMWTQQSGPTSSTMDGISTTTLSIQNLDAGVYIFRLTAIDNEGASSFSEATVTVKANYLPPTVIAPSDTTLVLPDNFLALTAEVISGDGPISEYEWTQVEGLAVNIVGEYPDMAAIGLLSGTYVFRLTVADNLGFEAYDEYRVIVSEGKSNPIAAALFFSPNDDAVNDVWIVENHNMIEGCPLTIFNSMGKKVFSADQYENNWNGTVNNQPLNAGDYYFVFECGPSKTYSGAFRLIR